MSRIGKKPIEIPSDVKLNVIDNLVNIEGPKGKLSYTLPPQITLKLDGSRAYLENKGETRQHKAWHGLARAIIANHIIGVRQGFKKDLQIEGVGFKSAVQGKTLVLNLGFSHPINYEIPEGIKITVTDSVNISVEGIDKQKVGAVAADIRRFYPPEPYKGKGIRYVGEYIRRKQGKTAQSK
ncbi:MAG: 50S ribosomal protein L6 [Methylacidiphilales bacterium]|nr:50S ribosomal protein L6 [Candidatus Methylacidiphilales bacterium]MDW8348973.1 50S ribosomal protein L6 [Verrucomicrobiae bacterium]